MTWVLYEKSTHVVVKFCAQRSGRCAVSRKVFFNLVRDLCKLNEGWSRSVSILVGSESADIFDLGGLRKKVLMSLSNFALKSVSVCSFTKNVFQSSQGLVQMK